MKEIPKHVANQKFMVGDKVYGIARIIALSKDLKPFRIPLKHLNVYNLHSRSDSFFEFVDHVRAVLDADLSCPIILDEEGYVMDGRHRIAKAYLEKKKTILAVRFDVTPSPCYQETE